MFYEPHCLLPPGQSSIACYLHARSTEIFIAAKSLICAQIDLCYMGHVIIYKHIQG